MTLDDLIRLAQSGARGFTTSVLGAPVDIANMAMGNIGGDKPVMGGAWIGDKLQSAGLLAPPGNPVAELAGGLLGPGDVAAAAKGLLGGAKMAQIVFHGSPYLFDRFDASKIGAGQGAQAYGHGMYFADTRDVADQYRTFAGAGTKGHVYKVDIPDAAIPKMLDWDRPLNQQPTAVQEALRNSGMARGIKDITTPGGEWLQASGGADAVVAQQLMDAGILGIRYLDHGSRANGEGTHNYVLFDPAMAKILGRE